MLRTVSCRALLTSRKKSYPTGNFARNLEKLTFRIWMQNETRQLSRNFMICSRGKYRESGGGDSWALIRVLGTTYLGCSSFGSGCSLERHCLHIYRLLLHNFREDIKLMFILRWEQRFPINLPSSQQLLQLLQSAQHELRPPSPLQQRSQRSQQPKLPCKLLYRRLSAQHVQLEKPTTAYSETRKEWAETVTDNDRFWTIST